MKYLIFLSIFCSLLFSKDILYKINSKNNQQANIISTIGAQQPQSNDNQNERTVRDDTTTVWLQDFEGDLSDWTIGTGWELTDAESYSPTNSFNFDDDNLEQVSSLTSPVISVPGLVSDSEILKFNFALWADLPDSDGDDDTFLDDYYWVDIANLSDLPSYFQTTTSDAYDGQSWWCADPGVGGYLDAWVQVLNSPPITVPSGGTMSAMMKWGIEDFAGATVDGTCINGWDAANVRISNDGGATWNLLNGDDPYDFSSGYGWVYNDVEYDCGGSLEQVSAGWGGQSDWHEVNFDLGSYVGQEVIIQFAFGSDPGYATPDDPTLTGLKIDNISVKDGSGNITYSDNADDQSTMVAMNGLEFSWTQYFYDYGDPTRPGSLGWEEYPVGAAFNGNSQLDISEYAGADILIRFTARTDDNDDGGNGGGLFIDDLHIWSVTINDVPMVNNLEAVGFDSQVNVSWDMPAGESYDNDDITYVDGTFEDAIMMTSGTSIMGNYFDMPYGVETVTANSCAVWGAEGFSGLTTLYGFAVSNGSPENSATHSTTITLTEEQWNVLDLGWEFAGDFILALEVSTTVGVAIDSENSPGQNSWANLGGWEPWTDVAVANGLTDGEFGINANVTTVGGIIPTFNVYRSVNNDEPVMMFNGSDLEENSYTDNTAQNGTEYCYSVSSIYGEDESNLSDPVCAMPEAQTIYEMVYDDGTSETSINAGNSNFLSVKFTPNGYPVDLYRVSFYCVGAGNGVGFVNVWDDDGDNGGPGTLLVENLPTTFSGGNWTPISMSDYDVNISEGSFYVGWMETPQTPPVGVDSDNSSENSFIDIGAGIGFEAFGNYFEGAIMIRAEVDSANTMASNDNEIATVPFSFDLKQNYPNPFNPITRIDFSLAVNGHALITLYDITGRKIRDLVNKPFAAGSYSFDLNASDLPSGMYFYKMNTTDSQGSSAFNSTRKLVLMK